MNGQEIRNTAVGEFRCGLASEIVRSFGKIRLRVLGTSMVPAILPGDLVSVRRVGLSEIAVGEIVLYSREDRLFVHRVITHLNSDAELQLITRGDRLSYNDPPVSSSEFLGRVVSVECSDGSGDRGIQSAELLSIWKKLFIRILRTSDFATYFYLRIVSFRPSIFSGRASCKV
jgi:signal peptidase I